MAVAGTGEDVTMKVEVGDEVGASVDVLAGVFVLVPVAVTAGVLVTTFGTKRS